MELWMLLGLGGALSSLVLGWDGGLSMLARGGLRETDEDSLTGREDTTAEEPTGPFEVSTMEDFLSGTRDDEIYVTATDDSADSWVYAERTDLDTLLSGDDAMAWFYDTDDRSDPENGFDTAKDSDALLQIESGDGDDYIEVRGHAATEIVTGAGADTVRIFDDAGYSVVHVEEDDTAYLSDDWTGYVIGTGNALVFGGAGTDAIRMTGDSSGSNVQAGAGDDDLVTGGGGILNGNQGDDTLVAYGDSAVLRGGTGDDHITSFGANTVIGGAGNDTVMLGDNMVEHSYIGDDAGVTTYTRVADVSLAGNGAADDVSGDDGDDVINFIDAGDTVSGGHGIDSFMAIAGDEASVITDFRPGAETLTIYETGGTMITHGSGTLAGEMSEADLDQMMQADDSYDLSGRVSSVFDGESRTTTILVDEEPAVVLQNCSWVTVGYVNGGDDTIYGLDGQPLAEGLRANVVVQVHENITQISQIG